MKRKLLPLAAILLSLPASSHASAPAWDLLCTARGETIHGVPYTEIKGTIIVNLEDRLVSANILEQTLPPFEPRKSRMGADDMLITRKTEITEKSGTHVILRMDRAPIGVTFNRFFEIEATLPFTGEISLTLKESFDRDDGERAPEIKTYAQTYYLTCRPRLN